MNIEWYTPGSWLSNDLADIGNMLGTDTSRDFSMALIAGHIDDLLESAKLGELNRDQASICKRQPGVVEIRLPEPIELEQIRLLIRIYYGEPPEWGGLVSLCLGAKDDSPNWKTQQNASIDLAQQRGEFWLEKRGENREDPSHC
ncbi:hypothetical protein ACX3T3_09820 [Actinotignum schaalii]|uniref:hypothetical protein n=1 Tax=unclassified Actinotignum TaxID=2632702 RepID=UPI003F485F42